MLVAPEAVGRGAFEDALAAVVARAESAVEVPVGVGCCHRMARLRWPGIELAAYRILHPIRLTLIGYEHGFDSPGHDECR